MAILLLPQRVRRDREVRECTWPPATRGKMVPLELQAISQNLIWPEAIEAAGVSNPWAPALAFEWLLEGGEAKALGLLRSTLLAQYVGMLEQRAIDLGARDGLLGRSLRRAFGAGEGTTLRLVLFELAAAAEAPKILAASLCPRWPLFPAAPYQSAEGLQKLTALMMTARGPDSADPVLVWDDGAPYLARDDDDAAFRGALAELAETTALVPADSPWRTALESLAEDAAPTRGTALPTGLLAPGVRTHEWECPTHRAQGQRWSVDAAAPPLRIGASNPRVACTVHDVPLEDETGRPVGLEDLGAAVVEGGSAPRLVYWVDARRNPDLAVQGEPDEGALELAYRGGRGPRIILEGEPLSLAAASCRPIGVPAVDSGLPDRTIPLQLEYVTLLEKHEWLRAQRTWRVWLKGRGGPDDLDCSAAQSGGPDAGVVVWPREAPEGWRRDVVGALTWAPQSALVERRGDGGLTVHPFLSSFFLGLTEEGPAAYIAFRDDGEDQGVLPIPRPPSAPAASAGSGLVAIDFGTSSTTVAYKQAGAEQLRFVKDGVEQPAEECSFLAKGTGFPASLELAVFSGWHQTTQPTELLGTLLVRRTDGATPAMSYSVIPRDTSMVGKLVEVPGTKVFGDLKWEDLARFDTHAVEAYLERVLLPAFCDLARQGAQKIRLAGSYPLAFERNRQAAFKAALQQAFQRAAAAGGIEAEGPVLFSESHAGIRALPALFAAYSVTIDMGGGTTDLAVLHGDKVLAADSLRIGGRALLAALCRDQDPVPLHDRLRKAVGVQDDRRLGISREALIETLLQARGLDATVAAVLPVNSTIERQACAALLSAIAVAAHRLLDIVLPVPLEDRPVVNLALLGQGWHLLRPELMAGVSEEGFVEVLTHLAGDRYAVQGMGSPAEAKERKLLLARGALELLSSSRPDESTRVLPSFLGMELQTTEGEASRATPVASFGRRDPAQGDPGYGVLIAELVDTMQRFGGPHASVGDPRAWLNEPAPGVVGRTRLQLLVEQACLDLRDILNEEDGTFARGALTHFLSGAWREAWVPANGGRR